MYIYVCSILSSDSKILYSLQIFSEKLLEYISSILFRACFISFLPEVSGFIFGFCDAAHQVALKKEHDPLRFVSS